MAKVHPFTDRTISTFSWDIAYVASTQAMQAKGEEEASKMTGERC